MTIVFATENEGKLRELRDIFSDFNIVSQKESGFVGEIEETGATFEENSLIKVRAVAEFCQKITIADDSGLVIDFLGGKPGVMSARYLGKDTPQSVKNSHILDIMKNVPDEERTARFVCAASLAVPKNGKIEVCTVTAALEGRIAREICGKNGFGYDPIFFVPEFGKTSAELESDVKNSISHRGKAFLQLKEKLLKLTC